MEHEREKESGTGNDKICCSEMVAFWKHDKLKPSPAASWWRLKELALEPLLGRWKRLGAATSNRPQNRISVRSGWSMWAIFSFHSSNFNAPEVCVHASILLSFLNLPNRMTQTDGHSSIAHTYTQRERHIFLSSLCWARQRLMPFASVNIEQKVVQTQKLKRDPHRWYCTPNRNLASRQTNHPFFAHSPKSFARLFPFDYKASNECWFLAAHACTIFRCVFAHGDKQVKVGRHQTSNSSRIRCGFVWML